MNWFERYGIVGMFFIAIVGMWFFCLFPEPASVFLTQLQQSKESANFIIGFCGLIFLPIGYLVVIFGQFLYYRTHFWEKIHCKYWEALPLSLREKIESKDKKIVEESLTDEDKSREAKLEGILTYYDRMYIKDVKQSSLLNTFSTKRYDVIAINRGFLLTIYITMFFAICIELTQIIIAMFKTSTYCLGRKDLFFILAIAISLFLKYILHRSSSILEWQIIEVGKRKLTHIALAARRRGKTVEKQDKTDAKN